MSLGPVTTKDKILDTAELLFSDLGFDNTSLRSITSKADVNLASVNYHFGSKKELIQAVMERYLSVLMPAIDEKLTQLTSGEKQVKLTTLFEAMVEPILKLDSVRPNGARTFMQLFAKAYYESQGHMKRFVNERYGAVLKRFNAVLVTTVPHLPLREIFWRWHFALGSCVFTMGSSKALTDMAEADYKQRMAVAELIRGVIHFIAAGFAAPSVEDDATNRQPAEDMARSTLCPERDIA
ncbi:TetR/AcrR family transcriptional regulator [Alteromonas sp. a30]|nr:TetR/AcrR family transcriptional regulator [Alteromonas sp. a30]